LRKIRLDLFPTFDAGVEADVWFSPIVESRTASGIVLKQAAAELLRNRLGEKPAILSATWTVIEPMHRNISPAIFAEEKLAYLALSGQEAEMRELLRSLVATLVSPRGRALAGWAARAANRLPEEARRLEEAQMLAFGSGIRLGEGQRWDLGTTSPHSAEWASWLSPDDLETVTFGVTLLEDGVEFAPAGRPGSHRIELPKTVPIAVEVGWSDSNTRRSERVTLDPYGLTIIDLGPGVTEVDIRTILGDAYWLTVPARKRESSQHKLDRVRPPRVQITYDVETGGAIELRELPFVIGVLASLTGDGTGGEPKLKDRKFVNMDLDNFDAVLSGFKPRLVLQIESRLIETEIIEELTFDKLRDFEPPGVAGQSRYIRDLRNIRTSLEALQSLLVVNDKLKDELDKVFASDDKWFGYRLSSEALKATGKCVRSEGELQLVKEFLKSWGFLESMPEPTGASPSTVRISSKARDVQSVIRSRIEKLHALLSEHVRAILHDPKFQALESNWRSLNYLVVQIELSASLRLRVLNLDRAELASGLTDDSPVLSRKIYDEEHRVFGGSPFSLFVGAYDFDRSPDDIALLENLSRVAAKCHAPFIAAASPSMFQMENFAQMDALRDVAKPLRSSDATAWNRLRESEDARFLGLTLPRVLLRAPYIKADGMSGPDAIPVEEFNFEEIIDKPVHSSFLWGSAAFPLAVRIAEAFATYSWPVQIQGVEGGGRVEGVPSYRSPSGENPVGPAEFAITDRRESELAHEGFISLCSLKALNAMAFFHATSIQKPRIYESDEANANARLSVQFPYVLAISRFAQYLKCMMRDKIGSYISREQTEQFLNRWISHYVIQDDNANPTTKAKYPLRHARIDVVDIDGRPGAYMVNAFLRPHFQLEDLTTSLRITLEVENRPSYM
jgi:type VI secretion system protein ImpC